MAGTSPAMTKSVIQSDRKTLALGELLRLLGFLLGQQPQELPTLRLVGRKSQTVAEVLEIAFADELFHRVAPRSLRYVAAEF
jgi:hypothetical protein